jgi:hypothetical protein
MSRTQVVPPRQRLRVSLVLVLCVLQVATIQKAVPNTPETHPAISLRETALAPRVEIPQIEKSSIPEDESPARPVRLIEQPRGWILPDSTWKALGDSLVKLDFETESGQTRIGVRFVIPFGER